MEKQPWQLSLFTKPWKTISLQQLGKQVSEWGFTGIEYPLRPGYQVDIADALRQLPSAAKILGEYGVCISSVAAASEEWAFAACEAAGVPLIRIMMGADLQKGYMACEAQMKRQIEAFLPLCEKYGVKVGIQPHYGPGIFNSMELRHLLEAFDSPWVGAIWDAAHSALAGEEPEQGLDILWDYLLLVNMKTAFYRRANGPEAPRAKYEYYFTTGPQGLADWPRIIQYIRLRGYNGFLCMPAEYTDEARVDEYIRQDIAYLKSLPGFER